MYSVLKIKVKKKSGSLEPDLLVVAVVTVLIRGSNRCGELDRLHVIWYILTLFRVPWWFECKINRTKKGNPFSKIIHSHNDNVNVNICECVIHLMTNQTNLLNIIVRHLPIVGQSVTTSEKLTDICKTSDGIVCGHVLKQKCH